MATKRDDSKALATLAETNKPVVPGEWSSDEQKLIATVIAKEAQLTQGEMRLFAKVCQHFGLDPFMRQVYAVKYQGKLTFQTGIDGYRVIAQRTGLFGGQSAPEWYDADAGEWVDVWVKDEPPAAARVIVYRTDGVQPTVGTAMFKEYAQYAGRGGDRRLNSQWSQRPAHMLAKCAEALALRRAFPADMSGIYTSEETGAWVDTETGEIHPPGDAIEGEYAEVEEETGSDPGPSDDAAKSEVAAPGLDVNAVLGQLRGLQEGTGVTMAHVSQALAPIPGSSFKEKLEAWVAEAWPEGAPAAVVIASTLHRLAIDEISEMAAPKHTGDEVTNSEPEPGEGQGSLV